MSLRTGLQNAVINRIQYNTFGRGLYSRVGAYNRMNFLFTGRWALRWGAYSKEPKRVTSFNQFTFFRGGINQSEVEDSFPPASDWIKSARKNENELKAVTLLGSLP